MKKIIKLIFCLSLCSCAASLSAQDKIVDFESCVAAGNPVLRSYPAKCVVKGQGTFIQKIPQQQNAGQKVEPQTADPLVYEKPDADGKICKDLCGNGICEEMVCMAEGCPCSENAESCPDDCK